ncbi:MAG: GAF domain-containing protein, partial [Anaerolineae bacterium]|nr:GAF domain-containing protein [Anaerolineae bacterium]
EPAAFDEEDAAVLQTMADQIALALENARLLEESRRTLRELERLYGEQAQEAWRERMAQKTVAYRYTGVSVEPAPLSAIRRDEGDSRGTDQSHQLTVPISLRGQTIGTIVLRRDPETAPWSPEEADLAQEIGGQVALALESARLLDETRRRAARDRVLADITARVRASMDPETILRTAVRELSLALGTDRASVHTNVGGGLGTLSPKDGDSE